LIFFFVFSLFLAENTLRQSTKTGTDNTSVAGSVTKVWLDNDTSYEMIILTAFPVMSQCLQTLAKNVAERLVSILK